MFEQILLVACLLAVIGSSVLMFLVAKSSVNASAAIAKSQRDDEAQRIKEIATSYQASADYQKAQYEQLWQRAFSLVEHMKVKQDALIERVLDSKPSGRSRKKPAAPPEPNPNGQRERIQERPAYARHFENAE